MTLALTLPISFSPVFPWAVLIPSCVCILAVTLYYYLKLRPILSAGWWRWLFAAKLVSLVVLVLAFVRPTFHSSAPDDRDFSAVFLLDASRSMGTADCNSKRRIDIVNDEMVNTQSPFYKSVIEPYTHHRIALFSEESPRPITGDTEFTLLPGNTDIDAAIRAMIRGNANRKRRIGTILLATDGNDNVADDLMSVSEELRVAGIPLNCVGIGDPRPGLDVAIAFEPVTAKVIKNRPFELNARLSGRLNRKTTLDVRLYDNDRLIESREVVQPKGRFDGTETFTLTTLFTGLRTYKIEVKPLDGEANVQNNLDYVGVEVQPPELFKCLYVSHALTWDFKYLKLLATTDKRLELSAIVRLGEDNWMTYGLAEADLKGVPEPAVLNTFDCLILDLQAMEAVGAETWRTIAGFVEQRGGGVIFTGLPGGFPEPLAKLLPARRENSSFKRLGKTPIDISTTSLLFNRERDDVSELGGIYLPEETPFLEVRKDDVKRAARVGASARDTDLVLVAGHNVGAGKTALVTVPDSWKWWMTSDQGRDRYSTFWSRLISWSATGPKERLVVSPGSSTVPLEDPMKMTVNLLTDEFVPDTSASVSATITAPDGSVRTVKFFDNPRVDGEYLQTLIPTGTGVHKVRVKIETDNQDVLETTSEYMFVDRSVETGVRPMAEGILQNIAQLTGGRYWRYDELSSIKDLPLATNVQMRHTEHPFASLWWFVLAVLLFFIPDWVLRRRIGLR